MEQFHICTVQEFDVGDIRIIIIIKGNHGEKTERSNNTAILITRYIWPPSQLQGIEAPFYQMSPVAARARVAAIDGAAESSRAGPSARAQSEFELQHI